MGDIAVFCGELKAAARSLGRAKGLTIAVILTLALGIGANAAIFSLVRGILLRPLVNRDEAHLIYIRQLANGNNATFSMPEISDLTTRLRSFNSFGDFSTIGFSLVGMGEPRTVRAGVVGGSYFQVMGLRPVLGRLLDAHDDGPNAQGAVVLTYRFWSTTLKRDPSVIGRAVRLGSFVDSRPATVVGVLEPCVPYPEDTEIIANVVTSQHHLSATMVTARIHRMTEFFARLAPGQDLKAARAELDSVYASMKREHPESYPDQADFHVSAVPLREELTSGARTILLVLMAASVLVFVIACSNVANLILARNVRREGELAVRAALGARAFDLRRILLAESLLLCVAGAALGLLIAAPLVSVLARYAARYSIRALDLTLDWSMLWVGAAFALIAAVVLAFVPRLPSSQAAHGIALSASSSRATGTGNRRLKIFALVQVSACFVLMAAAAATVNTLLSLQFVRNRFDMRVLAVNVPVMRDGRKPEQIVDFYREAMRQVRELPGVVNVAATSTVPLRDQNFMLEFSPDGHVPAAGEKAPRANYEVVSPAFFATLGLPLTAGRDFNDADRAGSEPVAIVSESLAKQLFPGGDAVDHHVVWTDKMMRFAGMTAQPRRIVGVVPDIDNTHLVPRPSMTIYHPVGQEQMFLTNRLVVAAQTDPYTLVEPITRVIRNLSTDQPVERASTLQDIRAEVLSPTQLNVVVSTVFAGVALLIAIVGVGGVLAFSVSGRTREFGIRLAMGSKPAQLLRRVVGEGAVMAIGGVVLGLASGFWLARLAGKLVGELKMPGAAPVAGAAAVLLLAAVIASAIPAMRAARVDVMEALRAE
jgi:putative ABC transport system permease protein